MAFIYDTALDGAIAIVITNGTAFSLTSQEVVSYAEVATYGLAKDTSVTCGAAANGASNGRRTIVPATDCVASATGTATHWALHNNSNTLVATGALSASIAVTNTFTYVVAAHSITVADAT